MTAFSNYSKYYDLLYKDKDYCAEAEYIDKLIKEYAPEASSVLELGCGAGRYSKLFHDKGYSVVGIDISKTMLDEARILEIEGELEFYHSDIREYTSQIKFDVVLALFHVMSYQATNSDLDATFATISNSLNKGGICLFDTWYGPGVVTDKPRNPTKKMENDEISVVRKTESVINSLTNCVDVNFEIYITDKRNDLKERLDETHVMRYLFSPEVECLAEKHGLRLKRQLKWMTDETPDFNCWFALFVLEKI